MNRKSIVLGQSGQREAGNNCSQSEMKNTGAHIKDDSPQGVVEE